MPHSPGGALFRAFEYASTYLDELNNRPVGATASLEQLRSRLGRDLQQESLEPDQVIAELIAATEGGHLGSAGPRFFAWVIGGSLTSALAADWLTSTWDQNAALYACGPAAAVVEEIAGAWLKDILGLPPQASFAFTSGCQLAHFTALAAARHAVLRRVGWDVNRDGLFGAPPVRVITNEHRHGSVDRALRFLGFGMRNMIALSADDEGRIRPEALQSALQQSQSPTIVVLDAADLNIGAFDRFETLIPLAKSAGAWVHIDGAFGMFARASRSKRGYLAGAELADSWATDGHKWLNVPFDSGLVFVRDREAHRAAMTLNAAYIASNDQARDQIDWNPEWSRRGRGFAVYAALRELGRAGLEELIDRTCDLARSMVDRIGALPGVEIIWRPHLNQGLVRFLDTRSGAGDTAHDLRTRAVIEAINATGEAFFSSSVYRGKATMRVSVVNWRTSQTDVDRTVAAVAQVLGRLG
ncbi:aminotransferase class V-fold PLP-dependent enzyme [Bradyrhizobium sp. 188]|uniref:pyridoxal phosphate-dependent decarboxylase family protein n=1 Tax=Bradyrhizobium sp. 188 TaxID=2782656 RepID=UPI001FF6FDE1|nr:aminotransferase class V-fold PLP-dependent enzyme [Bradyrhizobium sp. 188]MCK1502129.1 aspartate aminotransferase family protein [Bradyrhizobium sp. 188]